MMINLSLKLKNLGKKQDTKGVEKTTHFFGKPGPMTGKNHTSETKYKIRLAHIEIVKRKNPNNIFIPGYNESFCSYSDTFFKETGIYIQHAKNKGEYSHRGFFADGFIKKYNLWIEYDEPSHYFGGELRQDDIDRQNEIVDDMKCKFLRIKETSYKNFKRILLESI